MKAEIELGTRAGSVKLDGVDVARFLSGFSLTADANSYGIPARLYLDVAVPRNIHFAGDVEVELSEELVSVLVHMGWTPPNAATSAPIGSSAAGSAPPG